MDEKELKTSPKQRIFIAAIAIIMVGSIIASYAAIVVNGGKNSNTNAANTKVDEAKIAEYEAAYNTKKKEFSDATKGDFDKFIKYKSEVKAYNETAANENGVQERDLKVGSGDAVTDDNYLAYYIGWCADETIFDSSFDDNDNPTAFSGILDPSLGLIEGWSLGVDGMKLGGVREITVPGELAYGESREICGGTNKPLKFIIMAVANEGSIKALSEELETAYMRLQYAYYGIDYDTAASN